MSSFLMSDFKYIRRYDLLFYKRWIIFFLIIGIFISFVYADEIHTLESNETIYQISQKYNIPLEILLNSNNIHDPSHLPVGRKIRIPEADKFFAEGSQSSIIHTVINGDTLYSIAKQYDTDIQTLENLNAISTDDIIKPGMTLIVGHDNSATKTYVVAKGDTLYSIAEKYDTSIEHLQSLNNLPNGDIVKHGYTLMITEKKDEGEKIARVPTSVKNSQKYPQSWNYDKFVISPQRTRSINGTIQAVNIAQDSSQKQRKNKQSQLKKSTKNSVKSSVSTLLLDRATPFGVVSKQFPVKGTSYVLKTHSGVFIKSTQNSFVKAVEDGLVLYIVPSHGTFRNILVIQSRSGEIFVYGCQQSIKVKQGDLVKKGQTLGRVGIMPLAQEPVLYFAVFKKDKFVNPKKFLL